MDVSGSPGLQTPIFIPGGPFQVDGAVGFPALPTAIADYLSMYAQVVDLFGNKRDVVLCSQYNGNYFWQPVRPIWPNVTPMDGNQNITLRPLRSPTIIRITGTLTASRNWALDKTLAFPGQEFEFQMAGILGIFSLNITGLALGATLSMLLGGTRRVYFDGTDYQQFG